MAEAQRLLEAVGLLPQDILPVPGDLGEPICPVRLVFWTYWSWGKQWESQTLSIWEYRGSAHLTKYIAFGIILNQYQNQDYRNTLRTTNFGLLPDLLQVPGDSILSENPKYHLLFEETKPYTLSLLSEISSLANIMSENIY